MKKIIGLKEKQQKKQKPEMKMKIQGKKINKALRVKCTLVWNLLWKKCICDRKHKVEKLFHKMKNRDK